MKEITLTISDWPRVANAFAYMKNIPVGPDGEPKFTKEAWVKHHIEGFLMETIRRAEERMAVESVKVEQGLVTVR